MSGGRAEKVHARQPRGGSSTMPPICAAPSSSCFGSTADAGRMLGRIMGEISRYKGEVPMRLLVARALLALPLLFTARGRAGAQVLPSQPSGFTVKTISCGATPVVQL